MVDKYMKKKHTLNTIREMQIKTIMQHHYTHTRMTITKKTGNKKHW